MSAREVRSTNPCTPTSGTIRQLYSHCAWSLQDCAALAEARGKLSRHTVHTSKSLSISLSFHRVLSLLCELRVQKCIAARLLPSDHPALSFVQHTLCCQLPHALGLGRQQCSIDLHHWHSLESRLLTAVRPGMTCAVSRLVSTHDASSARVSCSGATGHPRDANAAPSPLSWPDVPSGFSLFKFIANIQSRTQRKVTDLLPRVWNRCSTTGTESTHSMIHGWKCTRSCWGRASTTRCGWEQSSSAPCPQPCHSPSPPAP